MRKIIKKIIWIIARKIARFGIVWPFLLVYANVIKEVEPRKKMSNSIRPTLLALEASRFRGDLEILSKNGMFRVLKMPHSWQSRIISLFFIKDIEFSKNYNPDGDTSVIRIQSELKAFLKKFLSSLYKKLKVDCVIGTAVHYTGDYYWGMTSEEIGVPYIVLHRENLIVSSKRSEYHYNRAKKMGKFKGSYVIVHNDIMKDIFIQSEYVSPDKISVAGCLRMDAFIKRIKNLKTFDNRKRKKVVLFSFNHGAGLGPAWSKDGNTGFIQLFENVHTAIAQLAIANPGFDFVIKPKWGGDWPGRIVDACQKNGIDTKKIANLNISPDFDVHELILSSDVVCGFSSTTLLEAAIASKPVIVPYFDEAQKPEYDGAPSLKDEFHLFDVAYSVSEFKDLILRKLSNSEISEECMSQRYRVFEKYISSMKGDALNKYIKAIEEIIYDRK